MLLIVQLWKSLCTKYAEGNNYCYRDRSTKKSATHFHQPEEQLDPFSDLHLSSFHLSNRRKIVSASGVPWFSAIPSHLYKVYFGRSQKHCAVHETASIISETPCSAMEMDC